MHRPLSVTLIAVYHVLFSLVLISTLVEQAIVHHPVDGWLDAAPVLLMLAFVSVIPAVLAYGLWIVDDGARIGTIVFTFLHLLTTIAYVQHATGLWRPWVRMGIDAAVIAILFLPSIRRAFQNSSKLLFDQTS